jgi:hypothetical protein
MLLIGSKEKPCLFGALSIDRFQIGRWAKILVNCEEFGNHLSIHTAVGGKWNWIIRRSPGDVYVPSSEFCQVSGFVSSAQSRLDDLEVQSITEVLFFAAFPPFLPDLSIRSFFIEILPAWQKFEWCAGNRRSKLLSLEDDGSCIGLRFQAILRLISQDAEWNS